MIESVLLRILWYKSETYKRNSYNWSYLSIQCKLLTTSSWFITLPWPSQSSTITNRFRVFELSMIRPMDAGSHISTFVSPSSITHNSHKLSIFSKRDSIISLPLILSSELWTVSRMVQSSWILKQMVISCKISTISSQMLFRNWRQTKISIRIWQLASLVRERSMHGKLN